MVLLQIHLNFEYSPIFVCFHTILLFISKLYKKKKDETIKKIYQHEYLFFLYNIITSLNSLFQIEQDYHIIFQSKHLYQLCICCDTLFF